jgi:hypothetical protein
MRILYVASDQTLPGETGGSVTCMGVARTREAARRPCRGRRLGEDDSAGDGYSIHRISWSPPHRFFRFRARPQIASLIERLKPDVVMERYNFGGGSWPPKAHGFPACWRIRRSSTIAGR